MATKTWIGTTSSLWSVDTNWVGGAKPVTTDDVVFDITGTARACTIDALGTFSGGTITVNSAYANTVTQSSGININCAAYAQTGATFTCSATATFTSTTFSVTGGTFTQGGAFVSTTFGITGTGIYAGSSATMSTTAVTHSNTATITATSGVWSLAGSWTKNNSPTFTHNGGTITITAASTFSPAATLNLVTIATTAAAVTISSGTTCPLGASPSSSLTTATLTVTGALTYSGPWTHVGNITVSATTGSVTGSSSPSLTIDGSLNISPTALGWTSVAVLANGANSVTYTDTGAKNSGTWTITKTGGTFAVSANTSMALGANPTTSISNANTMTISGTVSVSGVWTFASNGAGASLTIGATGTVSGALTALSLQRVFTVTAGGVFPINVVITFDGAATGICDASGIVLGPCIVNKAAAGMTVNAGTTLPLGTNPTCATSGSTFTVTGAISFAGTMTHTGAITATGTVTGTATPTMVVIEGAANFTSCTFTNPINVTMSQSSASSRTFTGGAKTYKILRRVGAGAGTLIVASSNTFESIQDDSGTVAHSIQFTAGTTQTFTATPLIVEGKGIVITFASTSNGSAYTLTAATGTDMNVYGVSLRDCTCGTTGGKGYAHRSTDVSGNTNWEFVTTPRDDANDDGAGFANPKKAATSSAFSSIAPYGFTCYRKAA